jgi:hypothetical protein
MRISGIDQRNGVQQYAASTASTDVVVSESASTPAAGSENSSASSTAKETIFGFKLGKFSVELATEHSEIDTQELAALALDRFQRAQASSFQSEMEIAQLRTVMNEPTEAASNENEQALSLASRSAANAYAKIDNALRSTTTRPGVLIGVA